MGSGWRSALSRVHRRRMDRRPSGRVQAATLVVRGALDDQAPEQVTRALYDALGGPKAYATLNCGSHELVYETQHTKLLQASAEWLRFGTYEGRSGSSSK
jgi:alpha-beta hydrolase superfamily lysophospholipase